MMRGLLSAFMVVFALGCLCYGLWDHDWQLIVASVALLVAWAMISDDVALREDHRRRELLDYLWDDEDLSESS